MAALEAARRLTEAHRFAQARIGADMVRRMTLVWPLLDPMALDATFERWATAAAPLISTQRDTSIGLASSYMRAFRTLELGTAAPFELAVPAALDAAQLATSLLVTGPVSAKRSLAAGLDIDAAMDQALANSSRSAMRHALNGGRDTITGTVSADDAALGWARATSGKPCHFCAMLASRGPVYGADTAGFEAHDGCSCSVEPVYREDAPWPAGSDRWAELWAQAKDADGETTKNFRRLIEAA